MQERPAGDEGASWGGTIRTLVLVDMERAMGRAGAVGSHDADKGGPLSLASASLFCLDKNGLRLQ